ncbi:MAG: DUF3037 domain-containing protein [Acidobacteria bacterium]|nr:DUF3037 domain-containing protein [Acidobacteriota bacterium]
MSELSYTYSIIRYVHDPAVGESLNIGVILWAPSVRFLDVKFEHRYHRLSKTFIEFDGEHYKATLCQFEQALERVKDQLRCQRMGLFEIHNVPTNLTGIVSQIWPDEGLSFQFGQSWSGITSDPQSALNEIFERMVASQCPITKAETRTDEDVWITYNRSLTNLNLHKRLSSYTLTTDDITLRYNHAFKNERWHLLEPVSMDYTTASRIQTKATHLLGDATAIEGHPEIGTLYLLLGQPREAKHWPAYIKAKNLLHKKIPLDHKLIEENEADDFAKYLQAYMIEHGLIEK